MKTETVIDLLQEIKVAYPVLTNDEILKILELKVLMEANAKNG